MKRLWMALAGATLFCAGCPVMDMAGTPEWEVYGKIKADFSIDTEETNPAGGDYVQHVADNTDGGNFAMGVRDSRFGARLDMGEVTGRVEVDFHDNDVLMRHAYVKLDLGNDMTLLAGQTTDVIAPLNPSTLNWTVGWLAGNIGHRSPQFRFEWTPDMGPINVQAALSDPNDDNVSIPDIQARVGFKLSDRVDLGAAIVLGQTDRNDDDIEEDVFGLAVDVKAKLSDKLVISGEWYVGKGLTQYNGNIGETPGFGSNTEYGATGLWVQVAIKPTDAFTVNAGIMFDSNDEDDVAGSGDREDNSCIFGNIIFHVNENTDAGIEISKWETEYEGDPTAYDNMRIQGSIIVKF